MTLPRWCVEPPSGDALTPNTLRDRLRVIGDETRLADPPEASEAELVARVRSGDTVAFETIYRATYAPLWRFATRLVQSRDVANDVVQDVFLSLWAQHTRLSVRTTIRGYLYGAVRQRALRYLRHQRVVDRSLETSAEEVTQAVTAPTPVAPDIGTEQRDVVEALRKAIHALPERQRLAMLLYLDDELTPTEIAMTLEITAVAVRKLLAKATERLREALPEA